MFNCRLQVWKQMETVTHSSNKYKFCTMIQLGLFLFILLTVPTHTYIAPSKGSTQTLQQIASAHSNSPTLFGKAVSFLWKIHPELSNYQVVGTKQQLARGDQTYASNLKDFHFDLASGNKRILAIVTVSTGGSREFVSISPFIISLNQEQMQGGMGTYWISQTLPTGTPTNIINNGVSSSSKINPPPGSYRTMKDFSDPMAQIALDKVAAEHPNMVNYRPTGVAYQMTQGVNVRIEYTGIDNYSKIVAIVGIDLNNHPRMLAFGAVCAPTKQYCTNQVAWHYFNSIETIVIRHPQLLNYRIAKLKVVKKDGGKAGVKVTFKNKQQGLTTLADIQVQDSKPKVLSFFTYND